MINIWPFQLVVFHCVEAMYRFLEYKLNCILHLLEYLRKWLFNSNSFYISIRHGAVVCSVYF